MRYEKMLPDEYSKMFLTNESWIAQHKERRCVEFVHPLFQRGKERLYHRITRNTVTSWKKILSVSEEEQNNFIKIGGNDLI